MKKLLSHSLPAKLVSIPSLERNITASLNVRRAMLPQLAGYPVPSHVVGNLFNSLALTDLNTLKGGIATLRDVARYASQLIASIPTIRTDRYQLSYAEITVYAREHAADFGYNFATDASYSLVAYLITAADVADSSWMLDMSENRSENRITQISDLYETLKGTGDTISVSSKKNDKGVLTLNSSNSLIYSPVDDRLVPFSDFVAMALKSHPLFVGYASLDISRRESAVSELNSYLEAETRLQRLADIKLVDIMLSVLNDRDFWATMIPARTATSSGANTERAQGLATLAGFFQSLLLYPHMLRYELFKGTYDQLSTWEAGLPAIPADVLLNYEQFVHKYDFLNAKADAADLLAPIKDEETNSSIHVYYEEMMRLLAAEDVMRKVGEAARAPSILQFTDLAIMRTGVYDSLLLSFPLANVNMAMDLAQLMFESSKFITFSTSTFGFLSRGYAGFFPDAVVDSLKGLKFLNAIPLAASPSLSYSVKAGSAPVATQGKYTQVYGCPPATATRDMRLKNELLYTIYLASSQVVDGMPRFSFDTERASDHRMSFDRDWESPYPGVAFPGDSIIPASSLVSSAMSVRALIERMSKQPYSLALRTLQNFVYQRVWATYLSSFALMVETKSWLEGNFACVEGYGMPYGVSYSELLALQEPANAKVGKASPLKVVSIEGSSFSLVLLRKLPIPGNELAVGQMYIAHPYYYYKSDATIDTEISLRVGLSIDTNIELSGQMRASMTPYPMGDPATKRPKGKKAVMTADTADIYLVFRPALEQMTLTPFSATIGMPSAFMDRKYAYNNDALVMQVDPKATYSPNDRPNAVTSVSLENKKWTGDKSLPTLEYVKLAPIARTNASGASDIDVAANALLEKAEKTIKEMESSGPESNPVSANAGTFDISIRLDEDDAPKEKSKPDNKNRGKQHDMKVNDVVEDEVDDDTEDEDSDSKDKKKKKKKRNDKSGSADDLENI